MKILSAIFLVVSLWMAVLLGGQTEAWSWGPAFLALALALACRLMAKPSENGCGMLWFPLVLSAVWIVWRSSQSPVVDFARADFMLVLTVMGTAWVVGGMALSGRGIRLLYLGVAISVIANVVMALVQWRIPEMMWPYAYRPSLKPTGFFGHYNYFANYVIGASLLLLGRAFFSGDRLWLKTLYGLAYVGALIVVPLSGSRGGLVALGLGSFVFLIALTVVAWRTKRRWLPAALVAIPLMAIGGVAVGWLVLGEIQESRGQGGKVAEVADNSSRLEWLSLALDVSSDHLLVGGGSRAYSWERNGKWNPDDFGYGQVDEPFVHNEILQTVTDYGLVGGALVLITVLAFAGVTMTGLFVGDSSKDSVSESDAVRVGVAGGASALLVQSNLSFVFHMMPSALLLGLMFGLIMMIHRRDRPAPVASRWLRHGLAMLMIPFIALLGWKATVALRLIWPVIYEKKPMAVLQPRTSMEHLEKAIQVWPSFRLLIEKASWARAIANDPQYGEEERIMWNELAVDAYRRAFEIHPFNPEIAVNLGNTYAIVGSTEEAELHLERAVELQGGLEAGFRGRYYLAMHLYKVWRERWIKERRAEEALGQFLRAQELLDAADPLIPWTLRNESAELRNGVAESIKFLEGAGVRPAEIAD